MKVLICIVLFCFGIVQSFSPKNQPTIPHANVAFLSFMQKYSKSYANLEEQQLRQKIFESNVEFIERFNSNSERTFSVAINQFADLTNEEFKNLYLRGSIKKNVTQKSSKTPALPDSWDWRVKGAVTPVKDQGQCGSASIYGALGSVEGCHFLTVGQLVELSESEIINCADPNCQATYEIWPYLLSVAGIDAENCYQQPNCPPDYQCCASNVTGTYSVQTGSESDLQNSVYAGPTNVWIDASQASFQFYLEGVYYEPDCSSTSVDHSVLNVGWGNMQGQDYWIVKNSWGTSWGMSGYIYMSRNKNNNCGIATAATRATGCHNCV